MVCVRPPNAVAYPLSQTVDLNSSSSTGTLRDVDMGEPLTDEDFTYADSDDYITRIMAQQDHDEDGSSTLFEGDIEISDEEQRQLHWLKEELPVSERLGVFLI